MGNTSHSGKNSDSQKCSVSLAKYFKCLWETCIAICLFGSTCKKKIMQFVKSSPAFQWDSHHLDWTHGITYTSVWPNLAILHQAFLLLRNATHSWDFSVQFHWCLSYKPLAWPAVWHWNILEASSQTFGYQLPTPQSENAERNYCPGGGKSERSTKYKFTQLCQNYQNSSK